MKRVALITGGSRGIGLGIANLVLSVVGVGVLVALAARPEPPSAVLTPPTPSPRASDNPPSVRVIFRHAPTHSHLRVDLARRRR